MNDKHIFELKNGIKVLIVPVNSENLTHISINILLGTLFEKVNEKEMTHYMEHLLARFTSIKYQDYKKIGIELSKRGSYTNAWVGNYRTCFFINGFYKDIEYYADILSNVIQHFYIEKTIIEQEKNAVIREITSQSSDPEYIFESKICKYMYKKQNKYQCDNIQSIKNMDKYTKDDIYNFVDKYIQNDNIIISVSCPKTKINETKQIIKKHFNFVSNKTTDDKRLIKYVKQEKNFYNKQIIWIKNYMKDIDSVDIKIIVDDDIKYMSAYHIALIYFKYIYFNFNTGVFYKQLRDEKGLIYSIKFHYNVHVKYDKSSHYYIETNVSTKHLNCLINEIINIFENLNITDEDINIAKKNINYDESLKMFNNLTNINNYYLNYMIFKRPIIERNKLKKSIINIDNNILKKEIKKIQKTFLKKCLIFYYSNKNLNYLLKKTINNHFEYNISS